MAVTGAAACPSRSFVSSRQEHVSMAHAAYIREKAREMRTDRRLTLDEIAERLALPRTTIYYWIKDLPVPNEVTHSDKRQAARRRGNRAMQRKYKLLREAAYREGEESFDELARDPTFRDFVTLYIAEGGKRNRNEVVICNSDPAVIALATRWLRRLTDRPLTFLIQYHADQDPSELRAVWGDMLTIDGSDIRFQRKSNSNQLKGRTWRSRHGVLAVRIYDTVLRSQLEAWMCRLRGSWQ
jgi:transcriptional regulator with XRE-family HTH domain